MDFVAIDVETANPDMASICQVGIAGFADGVLVAEWKSLVDPQDWFCGMNVAIHGIDEEAVADAPTLPDLADQIRSHLCGQVVISHTPFDRVSVHQAFCAYELTPPECTWLDSARVARRTWSECARSGYGLAPVCRLIGYEFSHHDALEDAKAAGQIMLAALGVSGLSVEDWLVRVTKPINPSTSTWEPIRRTGNPDGPLFGDVLVFTGALQIPRREAADLAATVGCDVADGVTAKTTILVVGDQDVQRLAGHEKSSKHRKAEALIAKGQPIRILRESDFARLVQLEGQQQAS